MLECLNQKRFDLNKRYIFDLKLALESEGLEEDFLRGEDDWSNRCNGRELKVTSYKAGSIIAEGKEHIILCPWWCREVG